MQLTFLSPSTRQWNAGAQASFICSEFEIKDVSKSFLKLCQTQFFSSKFAKTRLSIRVVIRGQKSVEQA
jgi:hypothetical protein